MFTKLFIQKDSNINENNNIIAQNLSQKEVLLQNDIEGRCMHCSKNFIKIKSNQMFCCNGCASVYQFLLSNDLQKYYEIMKKVGETPSSAEEFSISHYNIYEDENLNSIFKFDKNTWGFFVPEIKCAACIWLIEKSLHKIDGLDAININLLEKTITFTIKDNAVSNLKNAAILLTNIGYNPLPLPFLSSKQFRSRYEKERLKDIGISGFAFGNVMIFAASSYFGKYFGIDQKINTIFILISMIISLPATLYSGRSFFLNSFNALRNRKIHIDTTISFALIVTLLIGVYETFLNSTKVYFDTITGLVFLLLIGRYFHEKAIHKAKELGESMKNIIPIEAFSINKGDHVLIPKGGIFLADGIIIEGETEVNQSSLTGEEMPVVKKENDFVIAGAQNLLNPVKILAQKTGNETWISSLETLINQAKNNKSNIETVIEKILPIFSLFIIIISLLSFGFWSFFSTEKAVDVLVAILVISCPCALALATPLLMSSTLRVLWKIGAIVKTQNAIEALSEVDTVLFDKTGTLTSGELKVIEIEFLNSGVSDEKKAEILLAFYSLTKKSVHLVSKAIVNHLQLENFKSIELKNVRELAGLGIVANINNDIEIKIGNYKFINGKLQDSETRFCVYGKYGDFCVKFILSEQIKNGAKELIKYLNKNNIACYILSGDKAASVHKIAHELSINYKYCYSEKLPNEKLMILEEFQTAGKKVLALGDGVNDAAMLAKAHVGIASHGGTDVALHSADIFLRKPNLFLVKNIFIISKQAKKTLKILILVSLVYNFIAIYFAILGYVDPLFAAIFMPISSLSVFFIVYFRKVHLA